MEDKDFTIYNEEEDSPEVTPTPTEDEHLSKQELQAKEAKEEKRRLWSSIFTEGESEGEEGSRSLRDLISGTEINAQWFIRQIPLFLLVLAGCIGFVTNRYLGQIDLIEKARLEDEVMDWKYRSLTRSSELTEQTRQSQIEEMLKVRGDSTLTPATEPPFTINTEE